MGPRFIFDLRLLRLSATQQYKARNCTKGFPSRWHVDGTLCILAPCQGHWVCLVSLENCVLLTTTSAFLKGLFIVPKSICLWLTICKLKVSVDMPINRETILRLYLYTSPLWNNRPFFYSIIFGLSKVKCLWWWNWTFRTKKLEFWPVDQNKSPWLDRPKSSLLIWLQRCAQNLGKHWSSKSFLLFLGREKSPDGRAAQARAAIQSVCTEISIILFHLFVQKTATHTHNHALIRLLLVVRLHIYGRRQTCIVYAALSPTTVSTKRMLGIKDNRLVINDQGHRH